MQVEILNDFKHEGLDFKQGETRVVDEATGEYFCRAGWAKDKEGIVPTATPEKNETVLKVDNSQRKNTAGEA